MNVLSLFGGIECGRIAFDRAGIKIDKYFSSEIDPYPIKIAQKNYPDIIHVGSVTGLIYEDGALFHNQDNNPMKNGGSYIANIDLIIGGSPCQDLSIAKKDGKGLKGEKSSLFFEYVRLLKQIKPKYFLLENVASMRKDDKDEITKIISEIYPESQCYLFNSSLVSAQNRKRLYWTNIPGITQPEDRGILLRDILEDIPFDDPRWKPLPEKYITEDFQVRIREATKKGFIEPVSGDCVDMGQENSKTRRGRHMPGGWKSNALTTSNEFYLIGQFRRGGNLRIHADQEHSPSLTANMGTGGNNVPVIILTDKSQTIKGQYAKNGAANIDAKGRTATLPISYYEGEYYWRKLTPIECERLQTLPDNYTEGISDSRRYKAIGNGWTVDIISHIFSFIP